MTATVYFVTYYLHNKDNDGWAYKVVNKYTTLEAAKEAFYNEAGEHVNQAVYDVTTVILEDCFGNQILKAADNKVEPEPEPNE